jgi:hypothetical protein
MDGYIHRRQLLDVTIQQSISPKMRIAGARVVGESLTVRLS